jgi:hypothetical protein
VIVDAARSLRHMQLRPAIAAALPTQTYCAPTLQQLELEGSSEQSEGWEQRCRVSVPKQLVPRFVLQVASHLDDSDVTMQFGG